MSKISLDYFSEWYLANQSDLLAKARLWQEENQKLVNDFLQTWPLERLKDMDLDDYVTGKGPENKSLCYELEHGKYRDLYLGIRGGNAGKFGIYWSKELASYCNQNNKPLAPEELATAFSRLKHDLIAIIQRGLVLEFDHDEFNINSFFSRSAMVTKLLCIYSERKVFTGLNLQTNQKEIWGKLLPLEKIGGVYKQNYQLVKILSERHPELNAEILSSVLWEFRNEVLPSNSSVKEEDLFLKNQYSSTLLEAKNVIFRGAPGTGKTYLAQQIAADIISGGRVQDIEQLTIEEEERLGFVQFHPSYDYTDFVEGLRPVNVGSSLGFQLRDGIFKTFCEKAKAGQMSDADVNTIWQDFLQSIGNDIIQLNNFHFKVNSRQNITYIVPGGSEASLTLENVREYLETGKWGEMNYHSTYKTPIFETYILPKLKESQLTITNKPYVFIIDEINRGEMSKIFGELFFSLDPSYRGTKGSVFTQYANLHTNPTEKFYIPENVYIIGTMNDIDRSVDTFDFAMRRRFTFIEITAEQSAKNMDLPQFVKEQMFRLNQAIITICGLSADYQIGASYFKDSSSPELTINEAPLWIKKLQPLLKDYFRGDPHSAEKLEQLQSIYFNGE
ncbi:AAA family ATPase [Streptococcus suis]|uniref:AAA family ATPase n=1 Tax=Streptococcus suis TaxID=1307 RepID=UPI001432302C|nr:AAA domain-containing protein [Streptococcus suis]